MTDIRICTTAPEFDSIMWKCIKMNHLKWLNDKETIKYMSHRFLKYTDDKFEELKDSINKKKTMLVTAWIDNYHVGSATIQNLDYYEKSAELAFLVPKKNSNNGIGTRMMKAAIAYIFNNNLGIQYLWLGTEQENVAMKRVAERCGMSFCGACSYEQQNTNGRVTIVKYKITKSEYNQIKEKLEDYNENN